MAEIKRVNGDYTINTLGIGSDITVRTNDNGSDINLTTIGDNSDVNITATNDLTISAPGGTTITSDVLIDGDLVVTGNIDFRNIKNRLYVTKNGDDNNDGRSWEKAKRTIKNACETANSLKINPPGEADKQLESGHVTIFVAAGDYTEACPITVPEGCAIIGDNLRSVTVRPEVSISDVFYLNSNCYVWGLTVRGHRLSPSALDITPEGYAGYNGKGLPRSTKQTGFAFGFAPGAVIRVSPYIQNCSSISGSGVFGNPDYVPGGGGILVDPSVCDEGNRVNSIVLDAFTQINQGGIGCKVVGRGYMQLVSFFVNFCQFGILCVDGGHVTLLNSNCSFGNYSFWSEGKRYLVREPDDLDSTSGDLFREIIPYKEAREYLTSNRSTLQNAVVSWVDSTYSSTVSATAADDVITADNVSWMSNGLAVEFTGTVFGGISTGVKYYVINLNTGNNTFKVSTSAGGSAVDLSLANGSMTVKFYYDSGKCKRDVGYIIDALIEDLKIDSVIFSRRAGTAYWDGVTTLVPGQIKQTVDAISQLEYLIVKDFTNDSEKALALVPIRSGLETIKDYIKNGPNKPFEHARNLIDKNRVYLKNQVINYINSTYPGFSYNEDKCKRDIDYLIDAVVSDLITGSGRASRTAGNAYWKGTVDIPLPSPVFSIPLDQREETIAAMEFLRDRTVSLLINDGLNGSRVESVVLSTPVLGSFNTPTTTLTFSAPDISGGITATGAPIINVTGDITGIIMLDKGSGYTAVPTVTVVDSDNNETQTLTNGVNGVTITLNNGDFVGAYRNETDYPDGELAEYSVKKYFNTIIGIVGSQTGPDKDDLLISPLYEPARRLLTLNKDFIKKETVAYVNNELNLSFKIIGSNADPTNTFTCVPTKVLTTELLGRPIRFVNDPKSNPLAPNVFGGVTEGTVYYISEIVDSTRFKISTNPDNLAGSIFTVTQTVADNSMYCIFYSQEKCERDVGYIVDAIISDLATNSQESTLMAGNAYWRGNSSISNEFIAQIPDTLNAIDYAKRLSLQVINSDITPPIGDPATLEPRDIFFRDNGTTVYVLGGIGPKVYQYTCSPAWSTSGLQYVTSYDLSDRELTPQGMFIGNNGSKLYIVGTGSADNANDGRLVLEYDLSTPWLISTASYLREKNISNEVFSPSGIAFKPDGNKMLVVGSTDSKIYEYNLNTLNDGNQWNITTATYTGVSLEITQDNIPSGFTFNQDGTKLYVAGSTNNVVLDYTLTSPYSISSAVYVELYSVSAYENDITGVRIRADAVDVGNNGKKLYVIGLDKDSIIEYNLLTANDITSAEFTSSTPVGYYSTPYQDAQKQSFVARIVAVDSDQNAFTCDVTYGTLYLKPNQEIKFAPGLNALGNPGAVFGGVVEGNTYYIKDILSATKFTISETLTTAGIAGNIKTISAGNPTGSMVVAPSGASAAFDIEKNFNTIINIISNGSAELEEEFGSLIEATGYTLSYAGAGIDYSKLSKGQGGIGDADQNKYTIELNGGRVFITATDEKGDFYVGSILPAAPGETPRPLFRINQQTGAIDGRAFYQSIFGFIAPFVMALTRRK